MAAELQSGRSGKKPDTSTSKGPTKQESNGKKRLHIAVLKQMVTLSTGGFGLVAALAWNSVVQEFVATQIKPFLPHGSGLISLILYAVLMTTIAVVITYQLTRLIEKLEN